MVSAVFHSPLAAVTEPVEAPARVLTNTTPVAAVTHHPAHQARASNPPAF
ncbi:MAG: hypothetical protein IPI20_08240 [Rhodoferax sp.]|nr:hypothetical protein [Rhodoferax sp.]